MLTISHANFQILIVIAALGLFAGCAEFAATADGQSSASQQGESAVAPKVIDRTAVLKGVFGTYDAAPRKADGRVDSDRLRSELVDLKVNAYNYLIWHGKHDWEDLQAFLPAARVKGIKVWVSLVPPSESPPRTKNYSEPFQLDYARWAEEIAKLSARETNLVAWSIDDFAHNLKVYTPEALKTMLERARAINPRLAFVPCIYYKQLSPAVARDYAPLIDGVLFPYRNESVKANLTDAGAVEAEVQRICELLGPGKPVIVDVYATGHSRLGPSTPEYVRQVMLAAGKHADGLLVYCHQDPNRQREKYAVEREVFHAWAAGGYGHNP